MLYLKRKRGNLEEKEETVLALCRRSEDFCLTYTLLARQMRPDPLLRLFSIHLSCRSVYGQTEALLPDFTQSLKAGETFLFRLAQNEVFPQHLWDVWEDFQGETDRLCRE